VVISDIVIMKSYQLYQLLTNCYPTFFLYNVTPNMHEIIRNFWCAFGLNVHGGPHIVYSSEGGVRIVRVQGSADFKKYYDSVTTVILFNFSFSLVPL